jgi:bifunctional non-homologous end joining protein LigD
MAFRRKKPAAIGVKAPFPGFIEPQLATAIDKVPPSSRWLYEIKFDGYRVQVPYLINASSAIDGDVVVPAADGTADFSVLQHEDALRTSPFTR